MAKKENCWEFMGCGREPDGFRTDVYPVCKTAVAGTYDGINSGKNGGRFCWAVAGTFSDEKTDGFFAVNKESCTDCIFYQKVMAEEGTFNIRKKFLRFVFSKGSPIFKALDKKRVKSGEILLVQGAVEKKAYIIETGSALSFVEKDGKRFNVNHYTVGDIAGGLGILTGTPQLTTICAETDLEVRELKKSDFDSISEKDPELREFLTELAASRFDIKRPVSERKIGKFVAEEIIGRGGYSIVYKGRHKDLDIPVVIKMMRHNLALDEDFIENFRKEAHIIASLNHKNILRVYDIEELYKTVFLVMEHVRGESLRDVINSGKKFSEKEIKEVLVEVLEGLSYAHENGIVHRDMNPDNIMITEDGSIKILDFGLACPVGTEDFDLTGTLCYMPKEQIDGDAVDGRSDIYSVAVIAYEMITGERPFKESDFTFLMDPDSQISVPDPSLKVDSSKLLREFVLKAGSSHLKERFNNASEAVSHLRGKDNSVTVVFDREKKEQFLRMLDDFKDEAFKRGIDISVNDGES